MEPEHASFRYLQLKDAFRRMVVLGAQCIDKQAFCSAMEGVPDFYVEPLWQLYGMVSSGMVSNCMAEFDDVAKDADVARQLEELEGLLLQKGRPVDVPGGSGDAAAAAEDAARLAAKRHEAAELRSALAQVKQDIVQTQRQLEIQHRRAAEEKENYQQLDCHMTQVYNGGKQWLAQDASKA